MTIYLITKPYGPLLNNRDLSIIGQKIRQEWDKMNKNNAPYTVYERHMGKNRRVRDYPFYFEEVMNRIVEEYLKEKNVLTRRQYPLTEKECFKK